MTQDAPVLSGLLVFGWCNVTLAFVAYIYGVVLLFQRENSLSGMIGSTI